MSTSAASSNVPEWTIADRLRKARESASLSQAQLAELTGISRRTISTYEGGSHPKRIAAVAWAMATGVPLEWILTGETPESGPDGPSELGGSSTDWYDESPGGVVTQLYPAAPTSKAA